MNREPTMEEVNEVLAEIEQTMDTASEAMLLKLSALYAAAYSYKLRLMARETPRASH